MTIISAILLVLTLIYLTGLFRLYREQGRRLYSPTRELKSDPGRHGFDFENVYFRSADGYLLNGWYVPCPQARRVILLCHGNTGNIADCIGSISVFHSLGYHCFLFDYRGYGLSEGHADEEGTYHDVEAAWSYLLSQRGFAPLDVIVLGRSLGAAIATWLTTKHTPAALIIESTFTSVPDIAAETFRFYPSRLMSRYRYNTLENLRQVRCPVLVVHGREDPVIPYHHGRRLYDAAPEPRAFLDIQGSHAEGYLESGALYIDGLKAFLDRYSQPP